MARKSKWAQFTDNFNGVYGTFNKIGKDIESTKVMNNEYEDDLGNALGGDALDRRRMQELSKVYTKYGDTKGGLDLRAQQAKIESDKRANDLSRDTYDELVRQNGLLKTQQMISDRRGTDANTANTQSTTSRRDTLLPGEVDQQGATLDGTRANTANTTSTTNRRETLLPGEVDQQGATLDGTRANTANTVSTTVRRDALLPGEIAGQDLTNTGKGLDNQGSAIDVDIKGATSASTIDSTNTGNEADTAANKVKKYKSTIEYDQLDAEEQLLVELNQTEYDTPEDAQAAYIQMVTDDDRIDPTRKAGIIKAVNEVGLVKLQGEATKLAQGAQNALQSGGMDGLIEFYDGVDDGDTMRVERGDDGTVAIISTRDGEDTVMFSDSSDDAAAVVEQQMFNQLSRPGTGFEVVAQAANVAKTRAETERTGAQTDLLGKQAFSELLGQDVERARENLIISQTAEIDQRMDQAKSGLSGRAKIAEEGLADLLTKDQYILMAEDEPAAAAALIGDFMQRYQMKGAPPAGVDAQSWFALSEAEQQEYIEAGQ